MRIFLFVAFLSFFAVEATAKKQAIQLAAYTSYEEMASNKSRFITQFYSVDWPKVNYSQRNVFVKEDGKWLRVYLMHDDVQSKQLLHTIQANSYFSGAFQKGGINIHELTNYRLALHKNNQIPTSFTSKGISNPSPSGTYKIQLGVFEEEKSDAFLANKYGLTDWEKDNIDRVVSYDFTKVNGKVCRRYYYGKYDDAVRAQLEKEDKEEKTDKKFLMVTMK